MLSWGEWRPYAGPNSGFAETADGTLPQQIPGGVGYGPYPDIAVASGAAALSAAPRGGIAIRLFDGSYQQFFATETTIEVMESDYTWTSIDTGRALGDGYDVSFAHFGSYLINSDAADGLMAYNVETPAGNNAVAGAPAAAFIFKSNNCIVAGNCDGNNRRFQTSGTGDHTAWKTKGANGKTLEDGGALVTGFDLKNKLALLLQEDAVRGLDFSGGGLTSQFKIADGSGSVGARSAAAFNGTGYWLATDGFKRLTAGGPVEAIGAERVDKWFADTVSTDNYIDVQAAIDPFRKVVFWRLSATRLLGFAWALNGGAGAFFTATVATSALSQIATSALLLDDWDVFLDDQDIPLDSRFFQGGQPVFAALNGDRKFSTFTGNPIMHTLRTCIVNSPVTGIGNWMTPMSKGSGLTYRVGTSDNMDNAITFPVTYLTKERNGAVGVRFRGMNIQIEEFEDQGSEWEFSHGIDHFKKSTGGSR